MSAPTPPPGSTPKPDGGKPMPLGEPKEPTQAKPGEKPSGGKPMPLDDPKN